MASKAAREAANWLCEHKQRCRWRASRPGSVCDCSAGRYGAEKIDAALAPERAAAKRLAEVAWQFTAIDGDPNYDDLVTALDDFVATGGEDE